MNQQFKVKFYSKPEYNDDFSNFSSRGTYPENWYQQQFKNILKGWHLATPDLYTGVVSKKEWA